MVLEHQHSVGGLFKQGFGQRDVDEATALTSMVVSFLHFCSYEYNMLGLFLSIMCLISHEFVSNR